MLTKPRTDERTRRIKAKISSLNTTTVAEAQGEIRSMQPDEAVNLLVTMIETDRQIRRAIPFQILAAVSVGAFIYWGMSVLGHSDSSASSFSGVFSGVFMALLASNRLRTNTANLLSHFDDPRLIDALVLNCKDKPNSPYGSQKALMRVLPKLTPSQSHLVSRESRTFLNHALLHNTNKEFVLAILAAWEQVGDRSAIPIVEQLAGAGGFVEKDASIREAAAAALPAIRESANRASMSETLLRAAEPGEATPLLRPAASSDTPEEVLLRPAAE